VLDGPGKVLKQHLFVDNLCDELEVLDGLFVLLLDLLLFFVVLLHELVVPLLLLVLLSGLIALGLVFLWLGGDWGRESLLRLRLNLPILRPRPFVLELGVVGVLYLKLYRAVFLEVVQDFLQ
jgi:hypothetical protein